MNIRATILIGPYASKCANCNRGANWEKKSHDEAIGYGITDENRTACGITYEYVSTEYGEMLEERAYAMRPDLKPMSSRDFTRQLVAELANAKRD